MYSEAKVGREMLKKKAWGNGWVGSVQWVFEAREGWRSVWLNGWKWVGYGIMYPEKELGDGIDIMI